MARPRTFAPTRQSPGPAPAPPPDPRVEIVADGMLTVAAAVEFSGIGRSILYELMQLGTLPYAVRGDRRLIPRKALVAYLATLEFRNLPQDTHHDDADDARGVGAA